MKRSVLILILVVCCTMLCAQGQSLSRNGAMHTIRASGMAGAVSAVPFGVESLLYNPAGLAVNPTVWEIRLSGDMYFRPEYLFPILKDITHAENKLGTILVNAKDLISSSGAGASAVLGVSRTGNNWGAGLITSFSAFLHGSPFPLGTEGYFQLLMEIPVGYAHTFYDNDSLKVDLGIVLHPGIAFYRTLNGSDVDAIIAGTVTFSQLLQQSMDYPYIGMPIDTGIIVSVSDIPYKPAQLRFSAAFKNICGDFFIPGKDIAPLRSAFSVQTGVAAIFPFRLLWDWTATVSAEMNGFNAVAAGSMSFWKSLRLGAELKVSDTLFLRGGLAGGYPCWSAELRLFGVSIGCSWQTVEAGKYIGDEPLSVFRITLAALF